MKKASLKLHNTRKIPAAGYRAKRARKDSFSSDEDEDENFWKEIVENFDLDEFDDSDQEADEDMSPLEISENLAVEAKDLTNPQTV